MKYKKGKMLKLWHIIEILFVITIIFKIQDYGNKIILFTLLSEFFLFSGIIFIFILYIWFTNIKKNLRLTKINVSLRKTVKKTFSTILNQLPKYIGIILLYTLLFFLIISTDFHINQPWSAAWKPVYRNSIIKFLVSLVEIYSNNGFLFLFSTICFLIGLYIFITFIFVVLITMYLSLIKEITTTNQKFIREIYNENFEELDIFELISLIIWTDKIDTDSVYLVVNTKKANLLRTFKKGNNPPLLEAF